jgi:nicotinate dehydrogenase subunit A
MNKTIGFKLNGKDVRLAVEPDRMLLWVLRSDCQHTGPKYGCGEGFCGACTVLVDKEAVLACQYPVADAEGKDILTIEGLQSNGKLHPLQQAFLQHNALQCGYCTPGMILAAWAFLQKNPAPTKAAISEALEGNLCRCGSYQRIVQAVQTAAQMMKGIPS